MDLSAELPLLDDDRSSSVLESGSQSESSTSRRCRWSLARGCDGPWESNIVLTPKNKSLKVKMELTVRVGLPEK